MGTGGVGRAGISAFSATGRSRLLAGDDEVEPPSWETNWNHSVLSMMGLEYDA